MKIYILFELKNGAAGGGNQFLKALKNYFVYIGTYTDSIVEADVVLFNSHQYVNELIRIKNKYPNKLYIHRIDGPMRLYNSMDDKRDLIVNMVNNKISDATIFQSKWSKEKSLSMGIKHKLFETTIINAPNNELFNKDCKNSFLDNKKIRLISISWSSNWKKGFEVYKWLDDNLDFNQYEMTFVGDSPIKFNNIIYKEPMDSEKLGLELKKNDIFITASQNDPCSNSLIEAMHCGLPTIGLNDGGHTEIIAQGGLVFNTQEEIPELLKRLKNDYSSYQKSIDLKTIEEVGDLYFKFIQDVYSKKESGVYKPKVVSIFSVLKIKINIIIWKMNEKLFSIKSLLK